MTESTIVNMPRLPIHLILLVLSLVLGCGDSGTSSDHTSPAAPPESEGPTNVEMVAAMEAHYTSAILAHDALIQGDLDEFRARMVELDGHDLPEGSPEQWKPFDQRLHFAAGQARDVTELDAAASTMAAVALACGNCHQNATGGPVYPVPPVNDRDQQTKAEMRKHEWAVLMLWDGVTGPSEYAWGRGAEGLAETRIFGVGDSTGDTEPSLLTREATLRGLGMDATTASSLSEQARIYGRMLATCGDCHRAAGVKLPQQQMSPPPGP